MTKVYIAGTKLYCANCAPAGSKARPVMASEAITCNECGTRLIGRAPSVPHLCQTCRKPLTSSDYETECADCRAEWVRQEREKGRTS